MVRRFFITLLVAGSPLLIAAQGLITGSVKDARSGEALIGASVIVKNAKAQGVLTDVDYVGYRPLDVDVYDFEEPVEITLIDNSNKLDEVVVVGYGTQKRNQLTGSVTTIKADIFEKATAPTLDVALGGQVAGLAVTASSGQPGADSHIRIRGGNSVNADGFIYFKDAANNSTGIGAIEGSLNPLATINPNDIESIEVLKDVSATAIYGSRGANGVILITTKKGKLGEGKAHVNYNYTLGVSSVAKKLDLLTASEWAQYQKDYFSNKGGYTDAEIAALGKGTDWQDAVLRTAIQQSHELSINGGTEKNRYAFSANYTDQEGIILNSGFERYNFHTNVEWELQEGVHFGAD